MKFKYVFPFLFLLFTSTTLFSQFNYRIEGSVFETKQDYRELLRKLDKTGYSDEYKAAPIWVSESLFNGPRGKKIFIYLYSRPETDEEILEIILDRWERETGERPYGAVINHLSVKPFPQPKSGKNVYIPN